MKLIKMVRIIKIFLISAVLLTVGSCSSDDTPDVQSRIPGKEPIEHLKSVILDEKGDIMLPPIGDIADTYMIDCEDESNAHSICSTILGDENWDIRDDTYTYSDSYGSVKMTMNPKEGVYVGMTFNVKSLPGFTLLLTSQEFFENNNYRYPDYPVYECFQCGYKTSSPERLKRPHCMGSFLVKCY